MDLDNPKPSSDAVLPCVAALDFLAEAYACEGGKDVAKAVELWKQLANEHDTIRKKCVLSIYQFIFLLTNMFLQVLGVPH